jgi:hypothetical protein
MIPGAFVEFLIRRDRFAVRKVESAHVVYGIDLYRLEELAARYSKRIRDAVKRVCRKHR